MNDDGLWQESQKLISGDPDDSDYFARDVAIRGNQIAVGAMLDDIGRGDFGTGRVYVFLKDEATGAWNPNARRRVWRNKCTLWRCRCVE